MIDALSLNLQHNVMPSIDQRWLEYVRSLPEQQLASESVAMIVERFWKRLSESVPSLQPPNASPIENGGLSMSWLRGGRYLEIEIAGDGRYEWFFQGANDEGEEGLPVTSSPSRRLIERLTEVFS